MPSFFCPPPPGVRRSYPIHRRRRSGTIPADPAGTSHDARRRPAGRRFLFEAEVTGRLEHPGVAPVHGRGRTADGRPFYAMRFVEGETLQDTARRFHARSAGPAADRNLELRRLLRAFVTVCQTV